MDLVPDTTLCRPLPSPLHFRLLRLKAGSSHKQEVKYSFEAHHLAGAPAFVFLSYHGDDQGQFTSLTIGDRTISVTKNLHRALSWLWDNTGTRYVWLDKLCVDHGDLADKARHARMMGEIISRAEILRAWVGDRFAEEGITGSRRYLTTVLHRLATQKALSSGVVSDLVHQIGPILRTRWASNAWTVQEIARAAECELFWLGGSVSWSDFVRVLHHLRLSSSAFLPEIDNFLAKEEVRSYVSRPDLRRSGLGSDKERYGLGYRPLELQHALAVIYSSRALVDDGDLRDRIYSVLGLIRPGEARVFAPDYGCDVRELYVRLAGYLIRRFGAGFLPYCDHNELRSSLESPLPGLEKLPSWVPDYGYRSGAGYLFRRHHRAYLASAGEPSTLIYQDLKSEDADVGVPPLDADADADAASESISLTGQILGTVAIVRAINPCRSRYGESVDDGKAFLTTLRSWYRFLWAINEYWCRGLRKVLDASTDKIDILDKVKVDETLHDILSPKRVEKDVFYCEDHDEMAVTTLQRAPWVVKDVFRAWNESTLERRLMVLDDGYIGIGPADARENDSVVMFAGSQNLFVLRQEEEKAAEEETEEEWAGEEAGSGRWRLVGICATNIGLKDIPMPHTNDRTFVLR